MFEYRVLNSDDGLVELSAMFDGVKYSSSSLKISGSRNSMYIDNEQYLDSMVDELYDYLCGIVTNSELIRLIHDIGELGIEVKTGFIVELRDILLVGQNRGYFNAKA